MRFVLRILGTDILEIDTRTPTADNGYSAANAETERHFGFIPAGIEFTKPEP